MIDPLEEHDRTSSVSPGEIHYDLRRRLYALDRGVLECMQPRLTRLIHDCRAWLLEHFGGRRGAGDRFGFFAADRI
jgi:hypothetical protein